MEPPSETPRPRLGRRIQAAMPAVALLIIIAGIPAALIDTWETGRVYLLSQEFLHELPQRFTGPGRFRFVLQPLLAVLLGAHSGLRDARAGNPPYLFGLLFATGRRAELLRCGAETLSTLLSMGVILDVIFQRVLYGAVHPAAALVIGPILIGLPYAVARAGANRLARMAANKKESPA